MTAPKRKAGRPKGTGPEPARTAVVRMRLEPARKAAWEAAAEAEGTTLTGWLETAAADRIARVTSRRAG